MQIWKKNKKRDFFLHKTCDSQGMFPSKEHYKLWTQDKCIKNGVERHKSKNSQNIWKSHKKVLINPDFVLFCRFIIKDRETFFSSAQRSQMVWQILMRTSYDDDDSDKVGIIRLLSNGVFKDAYPLHDGRAMKDDQQKGHHCSRRVN